MILDITLPLDNTTAVWPGDPPFALERIATIGGTSPYALTRFSSGTHTGTHLDFPAHFFAGGKCQQDYAPDRFLLPALVLAPPSLPLSRHELDTVPLAAGMALLVRTGLEPFHGQPLLTPDAADVLVARGVGLAGFDTASLGDDTDDWWLHRRLLGADILIAERLALDAAPAGRCRLFCLPLAINNAEAAPVRALLEYRNP